MVAIYNTFGVPAHADTLAEIRDAQDSLQWAEVLDRDNTPFYIIGGGSNVLFTEDFRGVILRPSNTYLSIFSEDSRSATIQAGAGVIWDDLVAFSTGQGLWGLENLSGIPGNVGASPIQNIGAYGASCSDTLRRVLVFDLIQRKEEWINARELDLGYRRSIFKGAYAGKKIIMQVEFTLSKVPLPRTSYGRLPEILNDTSELTSAKVRNAVLKIRDEKLPRVNEFGSAGSFFKNPELTPVEFSKIKARFPEIPSFQGEFGRVKVPAGWLIEHAGWKGKGEGDVQVYPKQALIIVNTGKASGKEIDNFALHLADEVYQQFGIRLEREVNTVRPYRIRDLV